MSYFCQFSSSYTYSWHNMICRDCELKRRLSQAIMFYASARNYDSFAPIIYIYIYIYICGYLVFILVLWCLTVVWASVASKPSLIYKWVSRTYNLDLLGYLKCINWYPTIFRFIQVPKMHKCVSKNIQIYSDTQNA